jgi:hypothetical protein
MASRPGADHPAGVTSPADDAGRHLDAGSRTLLEGRVGHDLSRVRIHDGPRAAALARLLDARAATVGSDVFFGAGEFRPGTPAGAQLLTHELAHAADPAADGDLVYRQPRTGAPGYDLAPDAIRSLIRNAFRVELRLAVGYVTTVQPLASAEATAGRSALGLLRAAVDMAESATVAGLVIVLPSVVSSRIAAWVRTYVDGIRRVYDTVGSVLRGVQELSTVDLDGLLDEAGLQADWLALTEVWFFEESPQALGRWGTCNGVPCVTITSRDYVDDIRSRPTYQEAIDAFKTARPTPGSVSIGTVFRHSFQFTGPGSASGDYNAVEWFLGSYTLEFTVTAIDPATRSVTVDVVAANRSRWGSATRLPQEYHRRYGVPAELVPDMPRSTALPGGDFEQRFVWTDSIIY